MPSAAITVVGRSGGICRGLGVQDQPAIDDAYRHPVR
jgi:hypothetical protein